MPPMFKTRDGLVLCGPHSVMAFAEMDPPYRKRPRSVQGDLDLVEVNDELLPCGMCDQLPAPGRVCAYCSTPLHPLWPAVYCSNECAFDDA